MKKKNELICFIPARSGSKRLKNKNIKKIKDRPLVYWTFEKAIRSKIFDKIIFSTDSKNYFKKIINLLQLEKLPTKNIFFDFRSKKDSSSKKKIYDYIKNTLLDSSIINKKNDLIVQLLPTAPLRSIKNIHDAIKISLNTKKNVFSVSEYDFHVSFAIKIINSKKWKPLFKKSPLLTGKTRSQDQIVYYKPNPVINCLWAKDIVKNKTIYSNAIPLITSKIQGHDIDNLEDFKVAEIFLRNLDKLT